MIFKLLLLITIFFHFFCSNTLAEDHSQSGIEVSFKMRKSLIEDNPINAHSLKKLDKILSEKEDLLLTANSHIRLTAYISSNDISNVWLINLASSRAASVRQYCKKRIRLMTDWNFVLSIDTTKGSINKIAFHYIPTPIPSTVSSDIYLVSSDKSTSKTKKHPRISKKLPFLEDVELLSNINQENELDNIGHLSTNPVETLLSDSANYKKKLIALYFRWDKSYLDKKYLSNEYHLGLLDSILKSRHAQYIDSLTIVSYASPEGDPNYNQRLSEKRGAEIKSYIEKTYPGLFNNNLKVLPKGENWTGFQKLAKSDPYLPQKEEVLRILNMDGISNEKRQAMIVALDSGRLYYRYILPNYYRYLRNGASILIEYSPNLPLIIPPSGMGLSRKPSLYQSGIINHPISIAPPSYMFLAVKTNILYDLVGASNLGIEIPFGKNISVEINGTYSYWQFRNLYALQTLQGETAIKYWFPKTQVKNTFRKDRLIADPLRGLFAGVYGMYCSRYDVQYINGYQGDGFWSTGISLGYALPLSRNWSLEAELAGGYFYTPQYRFYHRPEQGHLMWQETGKFGAVSLTKASIAIVWLFAFRKNNSSYAK